MPNLSYRERFFEWIRDTFPHENHTFANGALPAAPSSYIHQCIMDFAPHNTDLAVIEFTMNDSQRQCGVDSDGRCAWPKNMDLHYRYVSCHECILKGVLVHGTDGDLRCSFENCSPISTGQP